MNLPQETLNSIKSNHPQLWREKAAAGLNDQLIAAAILSQVEQDLKNPPEAEALKRVKAAAGMVQAHASKFRLSRADLDKIIAEVREQFPELEIVIAEEPPGLNTIPVLGIPGDNSEVIEGLRINVENLTQRNIEVENWLKEAQDAAKADQEAVVNLTRQRDALEAELKAAQDLLEGSSNASVATLITQLRSASNIKEVREVFTAHDAAASKE
ncbi:MAG: hypothetical protein K9N47_05555 [Prosthecobacter sp.]|uniref:hypothetical protein n=1 Tax=Prosthecobacter sp. TaxID=1965333 RepID=UPI0025F6AD1A|nr:hypothetical protein [Prosthecobacter sp.]MCF7785566.1 hypothetical protein [Prosthecobacter sp.]